MPAKDQEISHDQEHFDKAWDERERARRSLSSAGNAAAGPTAGAAQVRRSALAMAATIAPATEAVAFGRFDGEEEIVYVGKNSILSEERDVLVVNWQARAAEPYYKATVARPMGVMRRRIFTTSRNQIQTFEDALFQELAARVEALTERERVDINDALLTELDRGRTSEMHDIVQTIHHSQYDLIQLPADRLLVIQGGPGTGKTAVVLHRVSWLLYNQPEMAAEDVLVIGPNAAFTQYIRKVLPGLGDVEVQHTPLTQLGPVRSSRRAEPAETAALKGRDTMAGLLKRALDNRLRPPAGPIEVETNAGIRLIQPQGVVDGMRRLASVPYSSGRNALRQLIESAVLATPGRPTGIPRSVNTILDRIWPTLSPAQFIQELLGSRQQLIASGGDDFTASDIERLYRQSASSLGTEGWSDVDVALLDEADWLINGAGRRYTHIVVDEAQDLSPMQLRGLARRSSGGSYTISGDIAQSTGPWAREDWGDVIGALGVEGVEAEIRTLEYGYRVPKEVYAIAHPLLEKIAPQLTAPVVVRNAPKLPEIRWAEPDGVIPAAIAEAQAYAGLGLFVGVICPDEIVTLVEQAFRNANIQTRLVSSGELGQSINLMSASESKGLEFDAVVVVEPATIAHEETVGLRNLYIALTRTTKYLSVVYSEALAVIGLEPGRTELVGLEESISLEDDLPQVTTRDKYAVAKALHGRGAPMSARQKKVVDDYATDLAAEIRDWLAPTAHLAVLQALALLLGVDEPTSAATSDPPSAADVDTSFAE